MGKCGLAEPPGGVQVAVTWPGHGPIFGKTLFFPPPSEFLEQGHHLSVLSSSFQAKMRACETQVTHAKGQGDLKCPHLLPLPASEAYLEDMGAPAPKTDRVPGHPEWHVP